MGNIEYIILLLCWLVKSNDFRGIQEVRLRTISLKGLPELQVIFFFKKYKSDVINAEDFQKSRQLTTFSSYRQVCVLSGSFLYLVSAWDFFL